jgi:hypothetical protein
MYRLLMEHRLGVGVNETQVGVVQFHDQLFALQRTRVSCDVYLSGHCDVSGSGPDGFRCNLDKPNLLQT